MCGFALNGHMLLGFNRLMQTLGVAAANHQAAREFVNDDDLIVLDDVVHVALHQEVGAQGAADVVIQLGIFRVVDVGDAERGLTRWAPSSVRLMAFFFSSISK